MFDYDLLGPLNWLSGNIDFYEVTPIPEQRRQMRSNEPKGPPLVTPGWFMMMIIEEQRERPAPTPQGGPWRLIMIIITKTCKVRLPKLS